MNSEKTSHLLREDYRVMQIVTVIKYEQESETKYKVESKK